MIVIKPTQEELLPNASGVYAFFLLLCSRQRLGLLGPGPHSLDVLAKTKENLIRRLRKIEKIFSSKTLKGRVSETWKGADVSEVYDVTLLQRNLRDIGLLLNDANLETLPSVIDAIEDLSLMAGPLYCGMAGDQTLEARYRQHKSNFYGQESLETFGCRFSTTGLLWDDLIFAYVPISTGRTDIRSIERLMHLLLRAPLSTS